MQLEPAPLGFLFLGEKLLVPHLLPITESAAAMAPGIAIDAWCRAPEVEAMIAPRLAASPNVRIRRAPGFGKSLNKMISLALLAPKIGAHRVAVCAEQTSLWLPLLAPIKTRFVKTSHGVGSMSARDDARRKAAWRMLVPSELERRTYLDRGHDPDRVIATGYVKAAFARGRRLSPFADNKPVLLYAPHWQRHRSSWWDWGRPIVSMLATQDRYNVVIAPHERLTASERGAALFLRAYSDLPHMHVDLGSEALIDGTYTGLADLYLGDTSSQVVEFLADPRPCIFLNSQRLDWRATDDHGFWHCGEVVESLDQVAAAIDRAREWHTSFAEVQRLFAADALGDCSAEAPRRAARIVLQGLAA
jgi:hypothetical protein